MTFTEIFLVFFFLWCGWTLKLSLWYVSLGVIGPKRWGDVGKGNLNQGEFTSHEKNEKNVELLRWNHIPRKEFLTKMFCWWVNLAIFFRKNGTIVWEVREMSEKWGNCVTLTQNARQLAGLTMNEGHLAYNHIPLISYLFDTISWIWLSYQPSLCPNNHVWWMFLLMFFA